LLIDGRRTAPCEIKITAPGDITQVRITLYEGRNRQIRKMCEAIGHPVVFLKRTAVGDLRLGGLPRGAWRYLTRDEVEGLRR
jgi:pseudouridine synthase